MLSLIGPLQNVLLAVHRNDLEIAQRIADRDRCSRAAVIRRALRAGLELELDLRVPQRAADAAGGGK